MIEETLITSAFKNLEDLARAYMPFVRGGAIFIATSEEYSLGDKINISMTLPNEENTISFEGRVIWVTPNTAKVMWVTPENTTGESRYPGVGVQLVGARAKEIIANIEGLLKDVEVSSSSDTI